MSDIIILMEGGLGKMRKGPHIESETSQTQENLQDVLVAAMESMDAFEKMLDSVPFDQRQGRITDRRRVRELATAMQHLDVDTRGIFLARLVDYKKHADKEKMDLVHRKRGEHIFTRRHYTGETDEEISRYYIRSIVAHTLYEAYEEPDPNTPSTTGLGGLFT